MWMFDMLPEGAFEPRPGGGMRLHGGKGGGAPAPDPRLIEAQIKSLGVQDDVIQRVIGNSERLQPLQEEQLPFEGPSAFYTVLLPIKAWTHADVFTYLNAVGAPGNAIYEHFKGISAPECMGCTAWWDDGKAAYLKARHPAKYREYRVSLERVKAAIQSHLADLEHELS